MEARHCDTATERRSAAVTDTPHVLLPALLSPSRPPACLSASSAPSSSLRPCATLSAATIRPCPPRHPRPGNAVQGSRRSRQSAPVHGDGIQSLVGERKAAGSFTLVVGGAVTFKVRVCSPILHPPRAVHREDTIKKFVKNFRTLKTQNESSAKRGAIWTSPYILQLELHAWCRGVGPLCRSGPDGICRTNLGCYIPTQD